ncbi:MAG: condensation domain-containing protein, partial [Myxococcota bacterium]
MRADSHGSKRILAYAVVTGDPAPSGTQLREQLGHRLPAFMIPSAVVVIDEFPLTRNGKLDRRALPDPEGDTLAAQRQYLAPRTELERQLAGYWSELLSAESIGVHDDFFALGGHSLLATQLISRLHKDLAVAIPLQALFEHPTIDQLTTYLDKHLANHGLSSDPIAVIPRDRPLPLSFAQQRLWFIDQFQGGGTAYSVPIAVAIHGELDRTILHQSLQQIVQRHEILRTRFVSDSGQPVQLIDDRLDLPMPVLALDDLSEQERIA